MCKKILGILFPTNVLGKDVRSIGYKLPDGGDITLNILFDGDRLQVNYTHLLRSSEHHNPIITPHSYTFTDGDTLPINIRRGVHGMALNDIGSFDPDNAAHNMIYLKCTNVESLEINGEQII